MSPWSGLERDPRRHFDSWGAATHYFDVGKNGMQTRQVEVYDAGQVLRCGPGHEEDVSQPGPGQVLFSAWWAPPSLGLWARTLGASGRDDIVVGAGLIVAGPGRGLGARRTVADNDAVTDGRCNDE